MSRVAITVRLRTKPGCKEALLAGLGRILAEARGEEGTEVYMVLESAFDDVTVWVVELYSDEAAYIRHRGSAVHHDLESQLGSLLDGTALLSFLKPHGMKLPGTTSAGDA
jgi:quinol monooxygenase YgiN